MMKRPENHVTKDMMERLTGTGISQLLKEEWPEVPKALVEFLHAKFPPRCMGIDEDERGHFRYAGFVYLTGLLREVAERQAQVRAGNINPEDEGDPDLSEAEDAQSAQRGE